MLLLRTHSCAYTASAAHTLLVHAELAHCCAHTCLHCCAYTDSAAHILAHTLLVLHVQPHGKRQRSCGGCLPGQFRVHVQRPGEVHIPTTSPEGATVKRTLTITDYNYSFCANPKCYLRPNNTLKAEWRNAAKPGPSSSKMVKAPTTMELVLQPGGYAQLVMLGSQAVNAVQVRHPQAYLRQWDGSKRTRSEEARRWMSLGQRVQSSNSMACTIDARGGACPCPAHPVGKVGVH